MPGEGMVRRGFRVLCLAGLPWTGHSWASWSGNHVPGLVTSIFHSPSHLVLSWILFLVERERESKHEQGRGRERGRQRIPSRLRALSTEPNAGLEPTNREIVT